jgi:hypothetical protein
MALPSASLFHVVCCELGEGAVDIELSRCLCRARNKGTLHMCMHVC